ncbi:ECF transporter S component [Janibacter anophelis]|uniref:ECF transporter S component n=1 Tax=Janibacter anophelis TaxID=319054 RepID=UPI000A6D395A|nr:ECF transporter S component [Janibacter anophelis]
MSGTGHPRGGHGVDQIVRDLQVLRATAGAPSYAEIVRRVTAARQERGLSEAVARPARTTVYDAFRPGRARLDPELVADIAEALDGDAASFRRRCLTTRLAVETTGRHAATDLAPDDSATVGTDPVDPGESVKETDAPPRATKDPTETPGSPRLRHPLVLTLACLVTNLLGYVVVDVFHLPFFLDMTGTGIAAIALGPWYGVAVAIATHVVGTTVHGAETLPFLLVNVLGALIWGLGVRSLGWGSSLGRYLALTIVVATACTALAAPILLLLFDGDNGHEASLVDTLVDFGAPHALAVYGANLFMSIVDKLISGFLILAAVAAVSRRVTIPGGRLFHALGSLERSAPATVAAPVVAKDPPAPPA